MTLEQFEIDFREADTLLQKQELLDTLLESDIDFDDIENKEILKELKEQLRDAIKEVEIEEDALINYELDETSKYKMFTCKNSTDRYNDGCSYYISYVDLRKQYEDTEIAIDNPQLLEYFSNIKPVCHIILDRGLGTLKRKEILDYDEFVNNFATYRYESV